MTPQQARVALQTAIVEASQASPATFGVQVANIAWDNVAFTPPKDEVWLRITIQHDLDNPKNISLGDAYARRYTYGGAVLAQIFTPRTDEGLRTSDERAWELAQLLQSKRFGSGNELLTQGAAVREIGNQEPEWWQTNVTVPFTYEHIS